MSPQFRACCCVPLACGCMLRAGSTEARVGGQQGSDWLFVRHELCRALLICRKREEEEGAANGDKGAESPSAADEEEEEEEDDDDVVWLADTSGGCSCAAICLVQQNSGAACGSEAMPIRAGTQLSVSAAVPLSSCPTSSLCSPQVCAPPCWSSHHPFPLPAEEAMRARAAEQLSAATAAMVTQVRAQSAAAVVVPGLSLLGCVPSMCVPVKSQHEAPRFMPVMCALLLNSADISIPTPSAGQH